MATANSEIRGESSSERSSPEDSTVGMSIIGNENLPVNPNPRPSASNGSQAGSCEQNGEKKSMLTFRNVLKEIGSDKISANIDVLVVGITGTGKSALINSILEEKKAKESSKGKGCTTTIERFSSRIGELNVTLIDTVGLQDRNSKEQTAIQEMKNDGQTVSLVLYCMKMGDHRFKNDDEVAMRKLHQAFGSEFFERVMFVLTFANAEDCSVYDDSDDELDKDEAVSLEILKKRFKCRIKERAEEISKFLLENFHIKITEDRVVPAGFRKKSIHHQQHPLPLNWLYTLLRLCCNEIKDKHHFSRLTLNYKTHFAIIIDNHGGKGSALKEVFKDLGFSVLYFTQISKLSFECLLKALEEVNYSKVASFALVFLSEGGSHHLRDAQNEVITFESILEFVNEISSIPKIFIFLLACDGQVFSDRLSFPIASVPDNSIILVIPECNESNPVISAISNCLKPIECHMKTFVQCFENIKSHLDKNKSIELHNSLKENFVWSGQCKLNDLQLSEMRHQIWYAMWYPVRCQTIDELLKKKDEVVTFVKRERMTNIASSTVGIIGAGMATAGFLFAIPTFFTSLGVSALGSGIGLVGTTGGLVSSAVLKRFCNSSLKEAQLFVKFDQQLSQQLNAAAAKYAEALESYHKRAIVGGATIIARVLSTFKVGSMISDGSEIVLQTAGRLFGAAIAAVTVPVDVIVLVQNCYQLAIQDDTGKNDQNSTIQCLIKQFQDSLKGFFHVCDTTSGENGVILNKEWGYTAQSSAPQDITVSTILSGPFKLPEGAVLVSAVYDILIEKDPVTIDIEHCVDILDESVIGKMSFAVAKADLTTKAFKVECITGGRFTKGSAYGSITVKESCLLCVVTTEPLPCPQLKYSINCSYTKFYHNFWTMKASFTKSLSAYSQYIQIQKFIANDILIQEYIPDDVHSFHFKASEEPIISIQDFMESNFWTLSPHIIPSEPILKKSLDGIGLIHSGISLKETIPFIEFHVTRKEGSKKECDLELKLTGTDLNHLPINCRD